MTSSLRKSIRQTSISTMTARLEPLRCRLSVTREGPYPRGHSTVGSSASHADPSVPSRFRAGSHPQAHSGWVTGVAFSPDGQRLVSGSWDRHSQFWQVATGEPLNTVASKMKEVQSLAFQPRRTVVGDGELLRYRKPARSDDRRRFSRFPATDSGTPGQQLVYSIRIQSRWPMAGLRRGR